MLLLLLSAFSAPREAYTGVYARADEYKKPSSGGDHNVFHILSVNGGEPAGQRLGDEIFIIEHFRIIFRRGALVQYDQPRAVVFALTVDIKAGARRVHEINALIRSDKVVLMVVSCLLYTSDAADE